MQRAWRHGIRGTAILPLLLLLSTICSLLVGAAEGGQVTLTCWGWKYTIDCLKDSLAEFNQAYPQIKVDLKIRAPQDIYQRLPKAINAGAGGPDVVVLENSHLPQVMSTGGLLDLTAWASAYKAKYTAAQWRACLWKDRVLALPWDSGPVGLWYRRDVLEKAGYKPDPESVAALFETWQGLAAAAKEIKERLGIYIFAFSAGQNDGRLFEQILQQQGLGYFDEQGRVILDRPEAVNALEILGGLYKEGLIQDAIPWTDAWYAGIRDGAVASIPAAVWMGGFIKSWIAPGTAGNWGVVPLPLPAKGRGVRTSNDGGCSLAVLKQTKKAAAAWSFIQFMSARAETQVKMLRGHDSFPAFMDAYADPFFAEPDPFFGGQAYHKLFADLAPQIPVWHFTENYAQANSLCSTEIQAYLLGRQDAKTALARAAANIRAKIKKR
ncbi:MAG: ABC transporter substrate-binding protein [Patescibacteria group bacterium]